MPATVTHSKSNTVADWVGVVTVGNSAGGTATINATDLVRPIDWNSGHAVTLNAVGSEISGAFSNSNGVSFGTEAGGGITGSYALRLSAGTTSNLRSDFTFSNLNGVSFGLDGGTVTASIAAGGAPGSVSAGTTRFALGEVVFSNSNGVSFGLDVATVTASHNGLTSQSNQNVTAGNGGFAFQTLSFSNANGMSFGTSAGSAITGSYTVPTVTNSSWTVSDNATSGTVARLAFTNLNGVTLSLSTGAGGSHTIVGSHNAITSQSNQTLGLYAVGNTTGQSSSSTFDARTVSFVGQGIASVGFSNGSVNISVPSGGGGLTNIRVSAGTTSNLLSDITFANSNGVTFGLNASTITASVAAGGGVTHNGWDPYTPWGEILNSQHGNGTIHLQPLNIPFAFQFDRFACPIFVTAATNTTGTYTISYAYLFYTRSNETRIDLLTSWSGSTTFNHSGTANSASNMGHRVWTFGATGTITEGDYFVGVWSRTSSSSQNASISQWVVSQMLSNISGRLLSPSNATLGWQPFAGHYTSTTTGAFPASINKASIIASFTHALRPPIWAAWSAYT